LVSDPPSNASAEDEKAERPYSDGSDRRHAFEPQKVRQGDIILTKPVQRWIFFGGVVAAAVLGLAIAIVAGS
jgi:hypothetical protein